MKKHKKKKASSNVVLIGAIVLSLGFLVSVYFSSQNQTSKFDQNQNNAIELTEFKTAMGKLFDQIDRDRDGKIFRDEANKFLDEQGRSLEKSVAMFLQFDRFDKDNNRYISKQEATSSSSMRRMFDMMDKNGDAKLASSEVGSKLMGKYLFD